MLSEHRHTGKLLAHHHTSYAGLGFLLLLTAVVITSFSLPSQANSTISARIEGPPPTEGATINDPVNNQIFNTNLIQVSGHCPDNTYVKISRNNLLAGSTICPPSHNYSIQIDLVPGSNLLQAQDYDFLDQPGPITSLVNVVLRLPVAPNPIPPAAEPSSSPRLPIPPAYTLTPLLITSSNPIATNLFPNQSADWQIKVIGGLAPYALQWNWGDGTSNIYSLSSSGEFKFTHTYKKPGSYSIQINVSDSLSNLAHLQLASVVNGQTPLPTVTQRGGRLTIAWPLWGLAFLMLASFWLGDKYQHRRPPYAPPLPIKN